jgi:hypothetical protein
MIDWDKLRKEFFEECTEKVGGINLLMINMAPHDMFEWIKKKVTEQINNKS